MRIRCGVDESCAEFGADACAGSLIHRRVLHRTADMDTRDRPTSARDIDHARLAVPRLLLLLGALFTAAAGYIHLREWMVTYRSIPTAVPGSWVVRVGFPASAAIAVLLSVALVVAAVRRSPRSRLAVGMTIAFASALLGFLIDLRIRH